MIVPCMVKAWLYVAGSRNCRPGTASSERMTSARMPAAKKKKNELTM